MKFVELKLGERRLERSFTPVALSPNSNSFSTDVKTEFHEVVPFFQKVLILDVSFETTSLDGKLLDI